MNGLLKNKNKKEELEGGNAKRRAPAGLPFFRLSLTMVLLFMFILCLVAFFFFGEKHSRLPQRVPPRFGQHCTAYASAHIRTHLGGCVISDSRVKHGSKVFTSVN